MPAYLRSAELVTLLGDAAREISRLDSPENSVARRLIQMQGRLAPLSTTVGDLARRVDLPPREILESLVAAGVRTFWHEGKQFRTPAYLESYLALPRYADPLPELAVELTPDEVERLAVLLDVEVDEIKTADEPSRPARRFAASQTSLPRTDAETTRKQA